VSDVSDEDTMLSVEFKLCWKSIALCILHHVRAVPYSLDCHGGDLENTTDYSCAQN